MKSRFLSSENTSSASQYTDQEIIKDLYAVWEFEKICLSVYLSNFFTTKSFLSFKSDSPVLMNNQGEYPVYYWDKDKDLAIYQKAFDQVKEKIDKCSTMIQEFNKLSSAVEILQKIEKNEPITLAMRQLFEEMIDKEKNKVVEEKLQTDGSLENQNKRLNYLDKIKNMVLSQSNVVSVTSNSTLFNRQETGGALQQKAKDLETINNDISEPSGPGYGF